jgi:phosphatidylglycerophosphate synthase
MLFCPLCITTHCIPMLKICILPSMQDPTEKIGNNVRVLMVQVARAIHTLSRGAVKPSHITLISLLGHIPAAWALWTDRPILAAVLIAGFGLMDALDGALARVQGTASKMGMFFDAVTDRIKETILYAGVAVYVLSNERDLGAWVVPTVAATSLLVSYVKAKGEMAISTDAHDKQLLNRVFSQGLGRYEIRMTILIIALLADMLNPLLNFIIALNLITAATRFLEVARLLNVEDARARELSQVKATKKKA